MSNMKNIIKISSFLFLLTFFASCEDGFQDANTDPEILATVEPQELFPTAIKYIFSNSMAFYYDEKVLLTDLQYIVGTSGNDDKMASDNSNISNRWGLFYSSGNLLSEMDYLVSKKVPAEQARYAQMLSIAKIFKVYRAWYASDVHGSMAYSEAFQVRHGGTDRPKYDNQSVLFATWENELVASIASLKANTTTDQVAMGLNDLIFAGNATKWIKTANALRLRMAMRLLKKDDARAMAIINAVLASPATDLMSSVDDDCVLVGGNQFTEHSNFNPDNLAATKPLVDFMNTTADPRLPLLFRPNNYSQANIDIAIEAGKLAVGTVEGNRYVGGNTSPNKAKDNLIFSPRVVNPTLTLDTLSRIQEKMFQAEFLVGKGRTSFPIITYAEFCFIKAELVVKAKIAGDAKTLYEAGVIASIKSYEKMASDAKVIDFASVTSASISAYLLAPEVAFNADVARQLEQIAEQSYIHFYKAYNESWALYKRTGLPNNNTVLKLEVLKTVSGNNIVIPRKYQTSIPSISDWNFDNVQAAITEMKLDPKFTLDMSGRVWWDSAN